jgi:hypothetical protein
VMMSMDNDDQSRVGRSTFPASVTSGGIFEFQDCVSMSFVVTNERVRKD